MKTMLTALFAAILMAGAAAADTASPYAGWQARDIKALSARQIDDLKAGRGLSLALAAELNGYPGPRHVLDLGEALRLTAAQRAAFEALLRDMQAEAQRLGAEILAEEAALDDAFRSGRADEAALREHLARLGALQGELRYVHLRAHLDAPALLSPAQVAEYNALRGYAEAPATAKPHDGHRHAPTQP